ncbi:MAG: outer membrane protein assembly factor BamD [Spirochaetaceae bacterium]|nr:MAG: outer membrane protein assembly factor BamD [Spirochaetaceae bacterium]
MNTRIRLLAAAGLILAAGCQSIETGKVVPQPDVQTDAEAIDSGRIILTLPRPLPPQAAKLVLNRQLPEPGMPLVPMSLSIPVAIQNREIPDAVSDLPVVKHQPEAEPPPVSVPYFPTRARGFRLTSPTSIPEALKLESSAATASPAEVPVRQEPAARPQPMGRTEPVTRAAQAEPVARMAPVTRVELATPPAAPARRQPTESAVPFATRSQPIVEQRELVARRGDPIAIDLEGSGWIFVGFKTAGESASADQRGIDYVSKRNLQGRTSFDFKAVDYGEYELSFQFQDNQQAVLRNQIVHLRILPDQDFAVAVERQQQGVHAGTAAVPGPAIETADALFDLGEYELALIEYLRNMRSGDPYLNDRLAACYEITGEYQAAAKYYRQNLGLAGEYGDRAAVGLVRSSIALKDNGLLMEGMPFMVSLESAQIGAELLEVARFQTENQHLEVAIQALKQYIRRYPDGKSLDEVYYRLARIYEVDSPHRNLEAARDYYRLLYDLFPESRYADRAKERLNYLNRHFFLVQ